MSVTIKFRRGNSSEWTSNGTTVLASGEPGYELDTGRFKIGDGSTTWNSLSYSTIVPSGFLSGSGINIITGTNGTTATISVSGLNSSYISDFNEAVDDRIGSGLFVAGTGVNLNYNDSSNSFTISVTGLISNPNNNRLLTSRDNTTTGIDAESDLTFDGTTLSVSGVLDIDGIRIDNSTISTKNGENLVLQTSPDINNNPTVSQIELRTEGVRCSGTTGDFYFTTENSRGLVFDTNNGTDSGYILINDGIGGDIEIASSGNILLSGNSIQVNGIEVSVSGHTHTASNITDFNSSVSGLLPVKDVVAGTGISISSSSGIYTITSTGSGVNADSATQSASVVTTVFNKTASTIPKMSAVYINGGQGDQPTIQLAIATGDATSATTYGLTFEPISSMSAGKVIVFGALVGVNTDQFNPTAPMGDVNGSVLYLSPTTSGTLTTTKPHAPDHIVAIGTIVRTHQNAGVIEVRVQNGFELEELHNVAATGASNNQAIIYNSASGLWMNTTLTSSLISDFNEAVDDRVGSGLFSAGTGINLNYNDAGNSFTVSVSGLINNPTNNRILTSRDTTTTGIDAESNLTFDGTNLVISSGLTSSTGNFTVSITGALLNIDNIRIDGNAITSTNTNGNLIIQSTGTGALQRTLSGNIRGEYAVDLQSARASGDQIAGGQYSVIGGGQNNLISNIDHATIVGGFNNQFSATNGSTHFIGCGRDNKIDSNYSYGSSIVGGYKNTIGSGLGESTNYSFIGGGYQNTIGGNYNQSSFIGGGYRNKIYSNAGGGPTHISTVICGGNNNTCSGNYSAILGGQNNNDGGKNNVFILGSSITGVQSNTTYVQNLDVSTTGDIDVLRINKFYHNNLSVATGVADSSLLITIVDPTGTPSTQLISGSGLRNSLLNQPAVLRFRQGTEAERLLITPASGEPIWTTDSQRFYIGDGTTVGGDLIGPIYKSGNGSNSIVTSFSSTSAASGDYSVVGGGNGNVIRSTADGSVIGGGYDNTVWSPKSYIGGGEGNTTGSSLYDYISHHAICGGWKNTISGGYSFSLVGGCFIGGGAYNEVSGDQPYHTIGGGYDNSINSQGYRASTIAGGAYNQIIGDYTGGSAIGGGQNNTIGAGNTGGYFCTIAGGQYNTISDNGSYGNAIGGGTSNNISNNSNHATIPGGYRAKTTRYGELSHAAGYFASQGDAQHSTLIARKTTTTNTANQVLFLDDSSARLTIPAKTTWTFEVKLSAYNDTDSAGAGWIFRGAIRRNGSNGTALIGTVVTENWQDSAMSSTSAGVVADDTNEALEIRVTGLASKNIRWVAVVDISQVSYGTP